MVQPALTRASLSSSDDYEIGSRHTFADLDREMVVVDGRVFSVGAKHEFTLERRIEHGLEGTRGQDRTHGRTGHEHAADVRDDAGGGDHACANGRRVTVGGHDGGASRCEDRTASSR